MQGHFNSGWQKIQRLRNLLNSDQQVTQGWNHGVMRRHA